MWTLCPMYVDVEFEYRREKLYRDAENARLTRLARKVARTVARLSPVQAPVARAVTRPPAKAA